MNTLPNTPRNTARSPISAKYSQPMPVCAMGAHILTESSVKMPPRTTTISTANIAIYAMVAALERALFFFAS